MVITSLALLGFACTNVLVKFNDDCQGPQDTWATGCDTGTIQDSDSNPDSDTDTAKDTDSDTSDTHDSDTDSPVDTDTDTDSDSQGDTDTAVDTDTDADTDTDSDSDADTDSAVDTDTATDTSGDTAPDTDTAVPSDTGIPGDTATDTDTAVIVDTGIPGDTGIPVDTSGDTAVPVDTDTGVPSDTGIPSDTDTGTVPIDADSDGYFTPDDCDDADSAIHPTASEVCDWVDNDCDGLVDNDAADAMTWYQDADNDGHGNAARATLSCTEPAGYNLSSDDCDDSNNDAYPGDVEWCDGVDNDCSGSIDDGDYDGDGATVCDDCDDANSDEYFGGIEVCDGFDNDCDGLVDNDATDGYTWYADDDGDGYGDAADSQNACAQPSGYLADATDCDDTSSAINPAATENTFTVTDETCDDLSMNDGTVYTASNGGTLVFTGENQFSNADFADTSDFAGWTLEVTPACTTATSIDSGDANIISASFSSTSGGDANGLLFVTSSGYCNPSDICYRSPDVDMTPDTDVALHYNVGNIVSGGMTMKAYLASDYDAGLPTLYELSESVDYGEQVVLHTLATQSSDAWVVCAGVDYDNSIVIGNVYSSAATVTP